MICGRVVRAGVAGVWGRRPRHADVLTGVRDDGAYGDVRPTKRVVRVHDRGQALLAVAVRGRYAACAGAGAAATPQWKRATPIRLSAMP